MRSCAPSEAPSESRLSLRKSDSVRARSFVPACDVSAARSDDSDLNHWMKSYMECGSRKHNTLRELEELDRAQSRAPAALTTTSAALERSAAQAAELEADIRGADEELDQLQKEMCQHVGRQHQWAVDERDGLGAELAEVEQIVAAERAKVQKLEPKLASVAGQLAEQERGRGALSTAVADRAALDAEIRRVEGSIPRAYEIKAAAAELAKAREARCEAVRAADRARRDRARARQARHAARGKARDRRRAELAGQLMSDSQDRAAYASRLTEAGCRQRDLAGSVLKEVDLSRPAAELKPTPLRRAGKENR